MSGGSPTQTSSGTFDQTTQAILGPYAPQFAAAGETVYGGFGLPALGETEATLHQMLQGEDMGPFLGPMYNQINQQAQREINILQQTVPPGPQRDAMIAEVQSRATGQRIDLIARGRGSALQALGNLGQFGTGAGLTAMGAAANLGGGAHTTGTQTGQARTRGGSMFGF